MFSILLYVTFSDLTGGQISTVLIGGGRSPQIHVWLTLNDFMRPFTLGLIDSEVKFEVLKLLPNIAIH